MFLCLCLCGGVWCCGGGNPAYTEYIWVVVFGSMFPAHHHYAFDQQHGTCSVSHVSVGCWLRNSAGGALFLSFGARTCDGAVYYVGTMMLLLLSLIRTKNKSQQQWSQAYFLLQVSCCFLVPHHFFFLIYVCESDNLRSACWKSFLQSASIFSSTTAHSTQARAHSCACVHACMAVFCMYVYVRKTCPTLVSWTLVLQVASLFGIKTCSSSKPLVLCVCVCVSLRPGGRQEGM